MTNKNLGELMDWLHTEVDTDSAMRLMALAKYNNRRLEDVLAEAKRFADPGYPHEPPAPLDNVAFFSRRKGAH